MESSEITSPNVPAKKLAQLLKFDFKLPSFGKVKQTLTAGEHFLAVELDEQEIKLAIVGSTISGAREISGLFHFTTQPDQHEDFTAKIQSALAELKIVSPRVLGVVPAHWVVTRNIEIPSRDPEEIREIVSLQAVRHTPYARNEIIVDYINLGVYKSVYSKVLLIIVPRAAVMRIYDLAAKLGFQVEKVLFGPEATAKNLFKQPSLASEKSPVCFIRIDTATSDFMIVQRGNVLFIRSIPIGAQQFAVAREGYLLRFIEELKQSFETYQGENIERNPTMLYLTGALYGLEDLEQMVLENLKLWFKRILDMEGIPIRKETAKAFASQNVSFSQIMAPAISAQELTVDLIPEENKLRKSVQEWSREIMKTGALAMGLFGLFCVFLLSSMYFEKTRVKELRNRYEPIRQEAQALDQVYGHVRIIKAHLSGVGKSIETLATLAELMPGDTHVTIVRLEEDHKFTVRGISLNKTSVFALVDKLEESDLFKNVQTKYITGREEKGKEFADFELAAIVD